jgi:peptidoglycan hydrolase CwlO-like protein
MIEKIKKNWKTILIVLLVLFSLNKCTVSCNRQGVIDKQNVEIVKQDSLIKAQNDSIRILNVELIGKNDKEEAVNNAHNLGNDYYTYTINKLNDSIKILNNKVRDNSKEISKLNSKLKVKEGEISNLNIEINKLKVELHNSNN